MDATEILARFGRALERRRPLEPLWQACYDHVLPTAFQPVVDRGIQLDQLPEAGPPRSAAAVRVAAPASLPQALGEQPAAQRLRPDVQALGGQLLAGEGGAAVGEALVVRRQHLLAQLGLEAAVGRPAPPAGLL